MASAHQLINEFRSRAGGGKFPNISRASVASGLQARVAEPGSVAQGSTSLCGPSVLMFAILSDRPEEYVQYVVDLYETGVAKLGTVEVEPGSDCRTCNPGSSIAGVDWIALASLRDSDNDFFDYDDVDDEVAGITMPGDLREWFEKSGYGTSSNVTNIWFTKGRETLAAAERLWLQGQRVSLFISAKMLYTDRHRDRSVTPDHWVALTSPVRIHNGMVDLEVFTWGRRAHRVPASGQIAVSDLTKNFYGYVAAKR